MTDKEKIIAYIDKLLEKYPKNYYLLTVAEFIDSLQEEPASKELKKAAKDYSNNLDNICGSIGEQKRNAFKAGAKWQKHKDESKVLTEEQCRKIRDDAFELGKDAMKQQMERYRIEHCKSLTNEQAELEDNFVSSHVEKNNRIPTFIDAIEYGMEYCKQQMMAKAVGATVHIDAGGYPYIPQMELYDYEKDIPLAKEGDKYKVILIKED